MTRDGGEHQREGIAIGRHRQPPKGDAGDFHSRLGRVGQPRRRCNMKVNHPRNDSDRLEWQLRNPKASHLQKAREGRRRTCDQAAVARLHMNAIVGYQARKGDLTAGRCMEEIEHEPRLARARRTANENAARVDEDCRGVNGGGGIHKVYVAGSRTRKRAPRTRSSTAALPGSRGATRFCASSRPPWASTICLEMNSPSPEF